MAFPVVANKGAFYNTGASTVASNPVAIPTGVVAGDLLLLLYSKDSTPAITWPTSPAFTEIYQASGGSTTRSGMSYRVADGSETGTAAVTHTAEQATGIMWRITGWFGVAATGISAGAHVAGASGASPDPPSVTPSWGAADNLWVVMASVNNGLTSVTNYPASYTGNNEFADAASNVAQANCSRNLNAASDDPGIFTSAPTGAYGCNTIVIRPAALGGGLPVFDPIPFIPQGRSF